MRLHDPQRCVDFSGEAEMRAEYDSERFLEPDGVRTVWERADDRIHVSNEILKSPYGREIFCEKYEIVELCPARSEMSHARRKPT